MNLPRKDEAFAFQTRVSDLLQNGLNNSLEDVLDRAFPPDKIIRIDSLSIDLGNISASNFEQEFKTRFIEALTKSLATKKEDLDVVNDEDTVFSKARSLLNAFIFFLEKGYLPWYSSVEKKPDWETELLNALSDKEYEYLLNWLRDNYKERPVIVERLVLQFSDNFIGELLSKMPPGVDLPWDDLLADYVTLLNHIGGTNFQLKLQSAVIREKIWQYAFQALFDKKNDDPVFAILRLLFAHFRIKKKDLVHFKTKANKRLKTKAAKQAFEKLVDLSSLSRKDGPAGPAEKTAAQSTVESADAQDSQDNPALNGGSKNTCGTTLQNKNSEETSVPGGKANDKSLKDAKAGQATNKKNSSLHTGDLIDVHNSGVVILHPFLKAYFADLDLLAEGDFISTEARARAVLLLNYLATGEADAAEFDLTLQKVLCGYPLEDTLTSSIILTDKEIAGSDDLLNAVTNHWEPLKHTSIAGLRGTFLQRNGNIEVKESGWLLKVEQKTVDVLLGKLPWGFSTIRLPWMQMMLSVDWY